MSHPSLSHGFSLRFLHQSRRSRASTLICILSLLCACSATTGNTGGSKTPLGSNRSDTAHSSPRLFVFDCGAIQFDDVANFGLTNEETSVRELSVPCYLIDHPAGRLLWDAGMPVAMAGNVQIKNPAISKSNRVSRQQNRYTNIYSRIPNYNLRSYIKA